MVFVFLVTGSPNLALASPSDFDVPAGHFFAQTGRGDGTGYFVLDEGRDQAGNAVRWWSEFQRFGGINGLGYPLSRCFVGAGGYTYQVFQRGVLQWRPELGGAVLANTFDWLQQAGRDSVLDTVGVPPAILDDGSNGDWQKARQVRLSWLTDPKISAQLLVKPGGGAWSVDDAIQVYGLPMSRPEKRGPFIVQRFQRIAFQLWVDAVPGMPAPGTVVGVLGGDMLKQSGVIPADALNAVSSQPGNPAPVNEVRGVYLSRSAANNAGYRQYLWDLAATTEINAVVVDIKDDWGLTLYQSDVPLAKQTNAVGRPALQDFGALLAQFRQHGLYVIGRIAVFKDQNLAVARPDLAITDSRSGAVWRDAKGVPWVDPFRQEAWDYNIALAKEAASRGVDEIQFDYIRFPCGPDGVAAYSQPDAVSQRVSAIDGFLARAKSQLSPMGVKVSADLFGYTAWSEGGLAVGQRLSSMARSLDVVSLMLYPSNFTSGIPGYSPAIAYPYEIVSKSVQQALKQLAGVTVSIRPWLQDFPDYAFDGRTYGPAEVAAEIRGARDGGASGWMLWNSSIHYTKEALSPK
jgi:hypothetical protein